MNMPSRPAVADFGAAGARNAARYKGAAIVAKAGGDQVQDDAVLRGIVRQLLAMVEAGSRAALVHGGGRLIDERMSAAGLEVRKVEGVRHTTPAAMEIISACVMELNGRIVDVIAEEAESMGIRARPFSLGVGNGGFFRAVPLFDKAKLESLGMADEITLTGRIVESDAARLAGLMADGGIPVIHPVCAGLDAPLMNVNADDVAVAVADAVNALRLIMCSDTPVLDKARQRIARIEAGQVETLVEDGTLSGGMINKVRAAAAIARKERIGGVAIIDGRGKDALLRELLSDEGAGTLIVAHAA